MIKHRTWSYFKSRLVFVEICDVGCWFSPEPVFDVDTVYQTDDGEQLLVWQEHQKRNGKDGTSEAEFRADIDNLKLKKKI